MSIKRKERGIRPTKKRGNSLNLAFSSEELLQQAIAGLLTRMPDVSGVQILQGKDERGKDIIFNIPGGFAEPILCACVVKNVKITGNVSSSRGARTVLLQAEQAFDSTHTNSFGRETKVERVYVVTPFDLSPTTIASIEGRLKERAGQVSFIGGSLLFDLFKKLWPDYFADEAAVINRHIQHTKNIYVKDSPLPSLAFQYSLETVSAKLMNVYVPQDFRRDLNNYQLGPALSSLPTPKVLHGKISKLGIDEMKKTFEQFDRSIDYLNNWGLCSSDYNPEYLKASLADFIKAVTLAWKKTKEYSRSYETITDVTPVMLVNPSPLIPIAARVVSDRRDLLKVVLAKLSKLSNFLTTQKGASVEYLSNPDYLNATLIGDCARASKDRILIHDKGGQTFEFPKNILEVWKGPLLIVASPGYGKTSFCRWNALQDAERFNLGQSDILPVYVPLHELARKPLGTFEETFLKTLGKSALLGKRELRIKTGSGTKKIEAPHVRLYLDGLDEVASEVRRQEISQIVQQASENNRKLQIVITARDYVFGPWLEWVPKIHLSEFSQEQLDDFIKRWLGAETSSHTRFVSQLRNLPSLRALMRIPLLATLTIMVFRQTDRLPETRTRLYEIFTDLLSGGWDMAKGVLRQSKFGQRVKIIVLSSLASRLHRLRQRDFGDNDIKNTIKESFPGNLLNEWITLRDEIINDGVITKSGSIMQFSHLSFQEFLVAKDFIASPNHLRVVRALELYLYGNDWWKEVLKFFIGLSSSPQEIASWLSSQIQHFVTLGERTVSKSNAREIVGAVIESFPEFPVETLARITEPSLEYKATLLYLKDVQKGILNN